MIEIIKDKERWHQQLALIEQFDFYHTYDYHHISKTPTETPVLIKYTDGGNSLLLPLLIRDIENSDFKDATSVYGYVGVLNSNLNEHFKKENFQKELHAFFVKHKIISVFSRLHPFIEIQEALLEGLGTVSTLGKVVYINLKDTLEDQRSMYSKRMKTYLNKARRNCTVVESTSKSDLDTFVHLYHENMKRVDASKSYFFDSDYFYQLAKSDEFITKLMLCIHNETKEIVGGALFTKKEKFVQFHLSGLDEEHFDLHAIKLIIDEMRIDSINKQYEYLNLGGGRGSNEDSLFAFKRSFSKHFKDFKIWKYIVDEEAYRTLTEDRFGLPMETVIVDTDFFPAYRATKKPLVNS